VGNHGYRHIDGLFYSRKQVINNVHLAAHLIKSTLYRPPYGRIRPLQYVFLKKFYRIVMWDVMTRDYSMHRNPEQITNRILKYTRPGSVLVFHDSEKAESNLRQVLPEVLRYYKELGYEFSAIPVKMTS
jgi:peptidoglycan/xylan/chitin deacetylase (PgdA/CDA1 family)